MSMSVRYVSSKKLLFFVHVVVAAKATDLISFSKYSHKNQKSLDKSEKGNISLSNIYALLPQILKTKTCCKLQGPSIQARHLAPRHSA
jgi:hypothetical protein